MKKVFIGVLLVLMSVSAFAEQQVNDGKITDVIVYHGQALVTRQVDLKNTSGDVELLVENLPERILPESLYAVSDDGVKILSVRYRIKEVDQGEVPEIKAVDAKIEQVEKQIFETTRNLEFSRDMFNKYSRMWELSLEGADVSLDRAAFSAEDLGAYTKNLAERNAYYHSENVKMEQELKDISKEMAELQKEKNKLTQEHQVRVRQAILYLNVSSSGGAKSIKLNYLVNNANWSPQYNLKAFPESKQVRVEYNAVVHQSSGEDWVNAGLALSTATPSLVASPPKLDPMKIGLTSDKNSPRQLNSGNNFGQVDQLGDVQRMGGYGGAVNQSEQFENLLKTRINNGFQGIRANSTLNTISFTNQIMEFNADKEQQNYMNQKSQEVSRIEGISVTYELQGKLTLPSKSDQQLVSIASIDTPAKFMFAAAPLLTDHVYLQAEIVNSSDTILLAGTADMFRNGQFVGQGDMEPVTIGQMFTAGFGVDSQIQVTREFKDKKTESFLGNRVDRNYYRLAINNYYDKKIALRLMERLPWTEDKGLSIELTDVSHPLSTDAEYLRKQRDEGILRWDLELEPDTAGEEATVVNYSFTLKYDNDMTIQSVD